MSDIPKILRVQDGEGRGPYRPGLSHRWSAVEGPLNPPWWIETGEDVQAAHARIPAGYHVGCGFRDYRQFHRWFTGAELRRLDRLGFRLVTLIPDIIIADTPTQIVFGCLAPLTKVVRSIKLASDLARVA